MLSAEEIQALEKLCNTSWAVLKNQVLGLPSEVGFPFEPIRAALAPRGTCSAAGSRLPV